MRWFGHCFCSFVEMWTRVHHSFIWTNSKIICICVSICFFFICEIIPNSSKSSKYSLVSIIDEQQHKTVIRTLITKSLHGVKLFSYWYFSKKYRTATHSRAHTHKYNLLTVQRRRRNKISVIAILSSSWSQGCQVYFYFFCSLHLILILIWNEFPIEIETLKWLLIEPESITVLIPLSLEWSGPVHWWFQVNSRSEINMFCLCR